jgi:hypothetical protein
MEHIQDSYRLVRSNAIVTADYINKKYDNSNTCETSKLVRSNAIVTADYIKQKYNTTKSSNTRRHSI